MGGPNVDAVTDLVYAIRLPLFVSGGVTTLDDIRKLAQLPLAGCIVGRAIYEGTIQFSSACRLAETSQASQLFLNDQEVTGFYHDHACWNSIRWRDVCAVLAYVYGADDRWEDYVHLGLLTAEGNCFEWDERRNGWQVLLENLPRHIPLQDVNWQERIQSAKSTGRTALIYKGSQISSARLSAWFET